MPGPKKLTGRYARIAERMLARVTRVLEAADIPYSLEAGTLLGIVRENRLLPWDDDVDITVTRQQEAKVMALLPRLRLLGYKVRVKRYTRDLKYFSKGELRMIKIKHLSLPFFQSDVVIDIFLKKLIGDQYYWTVGVHKPVLKSVPKRFYEELGSLDFRGKSYSVPGDYRGYLSEHYGDWRTPVREWNFKFDDRSVREKLYEDEGE
ncbi:LicD family protein [bacterium]|nr:LicD family protein [bacterium]